MAEQVVTLRLTSDAAGLVSGVRMASAETAGMGAAGEAAGRQMESGMSAARRGVVSISEQLRSAKQQVLGFAAGFVGIQGVRQLAALADQASAIRAQLQLATTSQTEFAQAQAEVFAISQRTSTALESTANLYARITRSTAEYGIEQARVLRLSETINQTFAVSGTAAVAQANAITQLTQAFAGGVLRAEEFNSIIENSPRLAQALADGLNIGIGELRARVNDGKIEVADMVAALENQAGQIQAEFERMPLTIERAWVQISNAVLKYVGDADAASGTSGEIAEAMSWLADHIADVVDAAWMLTKVLATLYTAQMLRSAALWTAELILQAIQARAAAAAAAEMGIATQTGMAASLKSIGMVNVALGGLGAFIAGWQIGTYLRDEFEIVADAGNYLVYGVMQGWALIERSAKDVWAAVKNAAVGAINIIRESLADLVGFYAAIGEKTDLLGLNNGATTFLRDVESQLRPTTSALDAYNAEIANNADAFDRASQANDAMLADMQAATAADFAATAAREQHNAVLDVATGKITRVTAATVKNTDASDKQKKATIEAAKAARAAYEAEADLHRMVAEQAADLGGPSAQAALRYADTLAEIAANEAALMALGPPTADNVRAIAQARHNAATQYVRDQQDIEDAASGLDDILRGLGEDTGMPAILKDLDLVKSALEEASAAAGDAFDPERVALLQKAMGALRQEALVYATDAIGAGLSSLKSMASEGSKAYAALETAQAALNLATAIGAIANQGMGDPYTAFARIAAMAAMMSQIVDGLGSLSGGFSGGAEQRQQQQGTGTVLGDASAKSESIANAVEITADATSQLVGINRGMLNALQSLQSGLGGASTLLARGAGDATFTNNRGPQLNALTQIGVTATNILFGGLLGGFLQSLTTSLVGARSKVTDQGILILGGTLSQLIEDISVGAYQEVQSRSWWFGSTHTNIQVQDLGDDVAVQFQLVLDSIADAVREGADALGLDMEQINAAIAQFQIEEIRISTMDLSAEEAQAELEAVFSALFDDLAGSIVPFIDQFQQVGEGLGETLVRVATGVQVTREAMAQLGFALDETDPEKFAQISEGLIAVMGGIDKFIEGMSGFVDAFAPEAHKFDVLQASVVSAFAQAGLTLPDTRDGMWELMQSLDATTESGREQIATLLQLADATDAYFSHVDDLWDGFFERFYTSVERAQMAVDNATAAGNREFADIGLNLADYLGTGGLAQFRADFEEQFATLTAEQRIEWLEAAAALAAVTDAQAAYNTAIDESSDALASARAEAERIAGIRATLSELRTDLGLNPLNARQAAEADVNSRVDDYIDRLRALNAGLADITAAEDMRTEAIERATAAIDAQINSMLDGLALDLNVDGLSAVEMAQARVNRQYDDYRDQLIEQGATVEQLARLEDLRTAALEDAAAATQAATSAINEYAITAGELANLTNSGARNALDVLNEVTLATRGDGLTDQQRALRDLQERFDQYAAQINAGRVEGVRNQFGGFITPGNIAEIEAALAQLEQLRLEAIANLNAEYEQQLQDAIDERYQRELDWLQRLRDWQDGILLNDQLSTLTPQQRMEEALRQYQDSLAAVQSSDPAIADAARSGFDQVREALLREARSFYGSDDRYTSIFNQLLADNQALIASNPASIADAIAQDSAIQADAITIAINDAMTDAFNSGTDRTTTELQAVSAQIKGSRDDSDEQTRALLEELRRMVAKLKDVADATQETARNTSVYKQPKVRTV